MDQASTAMKRASMLLALLLAALLCSAPIAALSTGHAIESAVLEYDLGQARGSLEQQAEFGSLTPDPDGGGTPDDVAAAASARDLVRHNRGEAGVVSAAPNAPAPHRSYQARAPPLG